MYIKFMDSIFDTLFFKNHSVNKTRFCTACNFRTQYVKNKRDILKKKMIYSLFFESLSV